MIFLLQDSLSQARQADVERAARHAALAAARPVTGPARVLRRAAAWRLGAGRVARRPSTA